MWIDLVNKSKIFFLILVSLFYFLICPSSFTQDYNFRNYGPEDGLAQSYIYSITQDVQGYLWICSGDGISRFNGFTFENFNTDDSLTDNFTTRTIPDGDWLWFGHMNGGISLYDGKKFRRVTMPEEITSPVTDFSKRPGGLIWASTNSEGFLELNKESGSAKAISFRDQTIILSFRFLDEKELLVGTNQGLLYCRFKEPDEIEIIRSLSEIPESKVSSIQKLNDGSGFYIATENEGIFFLEFLNKNFRIKKLITDQVIEFTGIHDIFEDSRSNLWLSSFGYGLIRLGIPDSGKVYQASIYNSSSGFITDNVRTIYEDLEGNIWCGNYGQGLTLLIPKVFSHLKFDDTKYGNDVLAFCFTSDYNWIGTENGLVKIDPNTGKVVSFFEKGKSLPDDAVTALFSSEKKELWIGTSENGILHMDPVRETITRYKIRDGILENSITCISGIGDQVYFGTKKGLFKLDKGTGNITEYSINSGGLPNNLINCLYADSKRRIWIGTPGSTLVCIQDDNIIKTPYKTGRGISSVAEDPESRIWLGSSGNGVFIIDGDSLKYLTALDGLLSDFCYLIICDNRNNMWVGHKDGFSKIRTTDFNIMRLPGIEGMSDNSRFNSNSVTRNQKGKIWFGSNNGIIIYDPSMESNRQTPPALNITSIIIDDIEHTFADRIILPPGHHKIRIDFIGISLKDPSLVSYQYMLEGYDQWSETKSTSVVYNRLADGEYIFRLKAVSGDGVKTEMPLSLEFLIKKPTWKKWWFFPANTIILLLLIYFYIKRREHKFMVERRILEEKVRERTYEIQNQKNEIELQRDLIELKNNNITSSILYASNIQQAVLPPEDLLKSLLPECFIFIKPKDIVSGDFYWVNEQDGMIFFAVADCTGHGVPGAFMSVLGITLLNEIVNIHGIVRSDEILNLLSKKIFHSLNQKHRENLTKDGMDIALCVLDSRQKKLQYSGGMQNLILIRKGNMTVIDSDRYSIGSEGILTNDFTLKELEYKESDMIYLFSDGYRDQFGGPNNKKYSRSRFYNTLIEVSSLPVKQQYEVLDAILHEWMKDDVQTDDITIMGVRLN